MALVALGLSLIYGVMKFMNFAHGEMAMLGAMLYFFFFIDLSWGILPSAVATVAACGVVAFIYNKLLFEPLRQESMWTLLIVSIGVSIFTKGAATAIGGGTAKTYSREGFEPTIYTLFDGAVTFAGYQVIILLSTFILLIAMGLFLKYTRTGRAIRAVSDNQQLSSVVGINVKRTINLIFIISTCVAGFAGIMIGYEQNVSPNMGLWISIFAFTAVILGGLGNIWGAVLGAFILGILQNVLLGIEIFGFSIPTGYKSSVAFTILILLLIFRPRGLFGPKLEEHLARK